MTDSDPRSGHIAPEELAAISEPGAGLPAEWLTAHLAKCRYCMAIYAEFTRARVESLAAAAADAVDPAMIATALEIPVEIPVEIAGPSKVAPPPRSRRGAVAAAIAAGIVGAVDIVERPLSRV